MADQNPPKLPPPPTTALPGLVMARFGGLVSIGTHLVAVDTQGGVAPNNVVMSDFTPTSSVQIDKSTSVAGIGAVDKALAATSSSTSSAVRIFVLVAKWHEFKEAMHSEVMSVVSARGWNEVPAAQGEQGFVRSFKKETASKHVVLDVVCMALQGQPVITELGGGT
jgi:hypothetical protein